MLARFLNTSRPVTLILQLLIIAGLAIIAVFTQTFALSSQLSWIEIVSNFILFGFSFLLMNFIASKNDLTGKGDYGSTIYILLFLSFPLFLLEFRMLLAQMFLLLAVRRIYSLRSGRNIIRKIFDAGLWIGAAAVCYPPAVIMLILIYTAIIIYTNSRLNLWLLPVIGFCTSVLLYVGTLYIIDQTSPYLTVDSMIVGFTHLESPWHIATIIFAALIAVASIFYVMRLASAQAVVKPTYYLTFLYLILCILLLIFKPTHSNGSYIFISFPVAIILANMILSQRNIWLRECIVWIIIATSIVGLVS